MLHAINPITLVDRTIAPGHLTVAISKVILITSLIDVTTFPYKRAITVLYVLKKLAFVLVAIQSRSLAPLTRSVFQAVEEMANISCSVRPLVLTESAWFTISISSSVEVAIVEYISALPILQ